MWHTDFAKNTQALCECGGRNAVGSNGQGLDKAGADTANEVMQFQTCMKTAETTMGTLKDRIKTCTKLIKERDSALKELDMLEDEHTRNSARTEDKARLDYTRSRYDKANKCATEAMDEILGDYKEVVAECAASLSRLYAAFFRRCSAIFEPWENAEARPTPSNTPHSAVPPPRPPAPASTGSDEPPPRPPAPASTGSSDAPPPRPPPHSGSGAAHTGAPPHKPLPTPHSAAPPPRPPKP